MEYSSSPNQFKLSNEWMRRGELCEAWSATRSEIRREDRFIEGAYPIYASHASGAYLWDVDGHRYVDYILGYGTVILGHADSRVTNAVVQELEKGVCLSPLWRPLQVELAELLTAVIPGAEMAYLMRTGSDATSGALRLARIYTGRNKVVRWGYNGWHDWTATRTEGVPASARSETLTFNYNDTASLGAAFAAYPDQIACVIMMPFELDPPISGFLQEVRDIAHENGALFILDEMRSGFRMSLGGAQQYFNVKADLATFSKAMSNGYPISAVVGREDVLRCVGRTHIASTFYANSAEMAAAVATISILRDSDAIKKIWEMGEIFCRGLGTLIVEYGVPAQVVGYPPCPFLKFTSSDEDERQADMTAFYAETTKQGVLFHPNHHWFISAAHTTEDIVLTLEVCRRGFEAMGLATRGR
ncbi:MAG TPA: aminotransferase class III-fold pyridoxal phosphate-dependent enzyme [Pyrinomonadaceae bacterium]|nr:aminotransferase class III-fold pyridoxal phosphate-dependent enzyme [Pyrinomonadaceae bacterium]